MFPLRRSGRMDLALTLCALVEAVRERGAVTWLARVVSLTVPTRELPPFGHGENVHPVGCRAGKTARRIDVGPGTSCLDVVRSVDIGESDASEQQLQVDLDWQSDLAGLNLVRYTPPASLPPRPDVLGGASISPNLTRAKLKPGMGPTSAAVRSMEVK